MVWHADMKCVNVLLCPFKIKKCDCENQQLHLSRLKLNKPPIGKLINRMITNYCTVFSIYFHSWLQFQL